MTVAAANTLNCWFERDTDSRMRRTRLMNVLGLGRSSEPVDLDALARQARRALSTPSGSYCSFIASPRSPT